jgi:hypothetical protein
MLLTGHLTIFTITFLYNDSDREIAIQLRKHTQVYVVTNSSCGSLYLGSYTLWKTRIVASPETSQK